MKRSFAMLMVALLLGAGLAAGEPAAPRKVPLIGVVRIERIFDEYQYAKDMKTTLEKEFKSSATVIIGKNKEIKEKEDALRNDPLIRPNGTRYKLAVLEIQRLKVLRDEEVGKQRKDKATQLAEFYRVVYKKFREAVARYAEYHKYDLIITAPEPELSEDTQQSSMPQAVQSEILGRRVQYIGGSTDVTAPIIDLMNRFYAASKKKP